jgi:hypothetical protein
MTSRPCAAANLRVVEDWVEDVALPRQVVDLLGRLHEAPGLAMGGRAIQTPLPLSIFCVENR